MAQLEKARIDTNNMKEKLRRLVRYQAFLQSVVDRSLGDNDYDEIIDILNRHKTLVKANVDLQEQQTLAERTVDNVRTKNAQELTSKQNTILVENSKIHEKQTEIENLKQSNTNMENTIEENAKRSASAKKRCWPSRYVNQELTQSMRDRYHEAEETQNPENLEKRENTPIGIFRRVHGSHSSESSRIK